MKSTNCLFPLPAAGLLLLSVGAGIAQAQSKGTIQKANPNIHGDCTMSSGRTCGDDARPAADE